MKDKNHIERLVEDTLNSMEHSDKAMPQPYLLSRINAYMRNRKSTKWDRLITLITRPAVAMGGMMLIVLLNIFIISGNTRTTSQYYQQEMMGDEQGFSITNTTAVYDIENIEP